MKSELVKLKELLDRDAPELKAKLGNDNNLSIQFSGWELVIYDDGALFRQGWYIDDTSGG